MQLKSDIEVFYDLGIESERLRRRKAILKVARAMEREVVGISDMLVVGRRSSGTSGLSRGEAREDVDGLGAG